MGKTIVIVVSPYGLGHATRQIALKDILLQMNEDIHIKFVCSEEIDSMLRRSILTSDRVSIEYIPFVPRLTMDNWRDIDVDSTIASFQFSIDMDTQVRDDAEWGRILLDADLIINDIESVHNPIIKKMGLPIVNISNFTWSDILYEIGAEKLAKAYTELERMSDLNLRLPASINCIGFNENTEMVGWLCREFDWDEVEEISDMSSRPLVFFSYSHKNWDRDLSEYFIALHEAGYKIISSARLIPELDFDVIKIRSDEPNVHHYIAGADYIIAKAGYGTVSEVVTSGSKMLIWKRRGYAEDEAFVNYITENGYGYEIDPELSPEQLLVELEKLKELQPEKIDNSNYEIAGYVLSLLF